MQWLAVLALLAIAAAGFIVAYMTSQTDTDETVVLANANTVLSDAVDSAFVVVDALRGTVQSAVLFVVSNLSTLLLAALVVGVALMVHYEEFRVLSLLDRFVRRIAYPAMRAGLWQVLHVVKFVYGTLVPLWNFWVVVTTQLTTGMYTIVAKCSARSFVASARLLAHSLVLFLQSFGTFVGDVFDKDWNVTDAVYTVQLAVVEQENVVACACRQLTPAAQLVMASAKPVALAQAVNALLNVFVTAVQEPVRVFTNSSFPDFKRTYAHVEDFLYYGGTYADHVLALSVQKFLAQLQVSLEVTFPDTFVFGVGAHLLTAWVRTLQWLQDIYINLQLPRPSKWTNTTFMVELLSVTPIFVELDFAVEAAADIVEWYLNAAVRAVQELVDLADPNAPTLLTDKDSRAVADVLRHGVKTLLGVPHLAADAATTILWRAVLMHEQTVGDAFKQFDGHWYVDNSCKARAARGENCSCALARRTYNPFGENPTLQADVFYNILKTLDALQHFGWGVVTPAAAAIKLPVQAVRVVLRGLVHFDEVLDGTFVNHYINGNGTAYTGQARCTTENHPGCEFNPTLPKSKAVCMYSYPDDLIAEDQDRVQAFYDSSDYWCNSLLLEFVLKEIQTLSDVVADVLTATDPTCRPYQLGSRNTNEGVVVTDENVLCAAAVAVRSLARLPLNLLRQLLAQLLDLLSGVSTTHFDTENRFKEAEQALFASVGTLAAPFPSPFKQVAAELAYAVASLPIVVVRGVYYAVLFAEDVVLSTDVDWDKHVTTCVGCVSPLARIPDGGVGFLYVELRLAYVYVVKVLKALQHLQHEFFGAFIDIANIVLETLSAPVVEWLQLLFKVGADILKFFATGHIAGNEFFDNLVHIFTKSMTLLTRVSMRILGAILNMLGPLGTFLNTFVTVVCTSLYSVLCSITCASSIFGGGCDKTFCDTGACLTSSDLGAGTHPFEHVPHDIFQLGWDGDSKCDRLVHAYKDYVWGDMRPLEHIELRECAEQRYIAEELSAQVGVHLPPDMIYNWKRKFEMAFHGSLGAMLYAQHLMGEPTAYFQHQWQRWGVPDYWLEIFQRTHAHVQHLQFPTALVVDALQGEEGSPSDVFLTLVRATNHTLVHAQQRLRTQPAFEWNLTLPEYTLGATRLVHTLDYAWDIQTDIDTVGPTECALLDNTVNMFQQQVERTAHYYADVYTNVTLPHFLQYLEYDDPWIDDFEQTMWNAARNVTLPSFYDLPPPPDTLDTLDNAYVGASCQPHSDDVFAYTAELLECFVTGTGDEHLPYVQHNLEYLLKYQFRTCKVEQITCDDISAQVDRMGEAVVACLWTTLALVGMQYMFAFPIGVFTFVIVGVYAMIFATHVWNYTLFCIPNLPTCLMDDVFAFTERYLIPQCGCQYFPALANTTCAAPGCYFVSQTTGWETCETRLATLYNGDHFNILWAPFTLVREHAPDLLDAVQYFPPLYQSDTFTAWMEFKHKPLTPVERDCLQLHAMDLVIVFASALAALFFTSTVGAAAIKLCLIPFKMIPSVCTLAYSMLVSLDQQTMGDPVPQNTPAAPAAPETPKAPTSPASPKALAAADPLEALTLRRRGVREWKNIDVSKIKF